MVRRAATILVAGVLILTAGAGCSDKGDKGKNGSTTTVASQSQGD